MTMLNALIILGVAIVILEAINNKTLLEILAKDQNKEATD